MRKMVISVSACLLFLFVAGGCAGNDLTETDSEDLIKIVATIYPVADIIKQLGGDRIAVTYLLPAGASPHTFEPTLEQAKLIADADLFVYVGAGLDEWAVRLTEAADSDLEIVELAGIVRLLDSTHDHHRDDEHHHDECHDHEHHDECDDHEHHDEDHHDDCDEHADDHHHCQDHGPADPHFWLDPLIVRDDILPHLNVKLASLSPEHKNYFENRFEQYHAELSRLHEDILMAISDLKKRDFIAFHSAWQYFSQRYGLREVEVIAAFPGQEPSAGWIAELIELVKEKDIGAILTEPQFSPALADRIAEESGIMVLVVDPLGGDNIPGRESYLELMYYNLDVFKEALK